MPTLPSRLRALKTPATFAEFFLGTDARDFELPHNVLLFPRRSTDELSGPAAAHHRFVLILDYAGNVPVAVDGAVFTLTRGTALLVFPYQFHHYIVHQNRAISWLFVTFELGHTATDWLAHMRNTPVRFTSVAAWADRLVEAYASRGKAGNRRRAEIVLLTGLILNELSRVCHPGLPPKAPRPAAATALAQRVNSFVYANMGSRLRIRDIALHCNLSDGRLRALYRAAMGLSLGAYLRRIRIRRGMDLMRSADMKLSRVATECGYGSLVAFSYAFKREAGMTPGAFRRQRPGE